MSFTTHADPWLAEVMRRPVFRVDGSGSAHELVLVPGFYFAKISTDRIADVRELERRGFGVVDTNVTFELQRDVAVPGSVEVGELRADEADAVLAIAGSAFRYSRFHLDPEIGSELAHNVKREWIRNYVRGVRGDGLLVARLEGRPVGFLAPLVSNGTAVIDLVAVAIEAHGRGAGGALVGAFCARYAGKPRIVGTQVANVPSIRLYTKHGFALARSQYILHHHAS
ncbi:MAG TPA: GNAT family N-acetyltransferase [Kofleriaceae bacterium]|jgi:ribosomal protein S18 acetylase RimI-like enzyme